MKMQATIEFEYPKHTQHPLFRLCIECALAMEGGYPQDVQNSLASMLKAEAVEHLGTQNFHEEEV